MVFVVLARSAPVLLLAALLFVPAAAAENPEITVPQVAPVVEGLAGGADEARAGAVVLTVFLLDSPQTFSDECGAIVSDLMLCQAGLVLGATGEAAGQATEGVDTASAPVVAIVLVKLQETEDVYRATADGILPAAFGATDVIVEASHGAAVLLVDAFHGSLVNIYDSTQGLLREVRLGPSCTSFMALLSDLYEPLGALVACEDVPHGGMVADAFPPLPPGESVAALVPAPPPTLPVYEGVPDLWPL